MPEYEIVYWAQVLALAVAIVMIVSARRAFNGFAAGLISLGVLLILRRIDDTTGALGHTVMATVSSLVVAMYCYEVWRVWKDRRDHAAWMHWREQQAAELKLLHEWQARKAELARREEELERLRAAGSDQLYGWDHEYPLAAQARNIPLKKK